MFKKKLCEALITWELECKGPLLIRDERWAEPLTLAGGKEQGFPDTVFLSHLTTDKIKGDLLKINGKPVPPKNFPFYVPGTSLRGPFRSQAEFILRSLQAPEAPAGKSACNPFEQEEKHCQSCSKRLENVSNSAQKYKEACPACKIFGCAGLASRISFMDADIQRYTSVYRDMVAIDRFTGGAVKGALMRFHVLEGTKFSTSIRLTNFDLWQLGLLAYTFRDFAASQVAIGFGKSKGFGLVHAKVSKIVFSWPKASQAVEHLGSLIPDEEKETYGITRRAALDIGPHLKECKAQPLSWYQQYSLEDPPGLDAIWQGAAAAFNEYMEAGS